MAATTARAITAVIVTLDDALGKLDADDIAKAETTAEMDVADLHVLRDTVALAHAEGTIDVDTALVLQGILGGWKTATLAEKMVAMQTVAILAKGVV